MIKLDNGSYGNVYKYMKNDNVYIIKQLISSYPYPICIESSISHYFMYNTHPYIINIFDIYNTNHNIYISMEYCDNDTLLGLSETQICKYIFQLLLALKFLHDNGFIHRDIKPRNIIKKNDDIKLIDFGISIYTFERKKYKNKSIDFNESDVNIDLFLYDRYIYNDDSDIIIEKYPKNKTDIVQTYPYRAPEIYANQEYTNKIDIWSVGCILYELLSRKRLFRSNEESTKKTILNDPIFVTNAINNLNCSDSCKDILSKMLIKDPNLRIDTDECLNHIWFKQTDNIYNKYILSSHIKNPPHINDHMFIDTEIEKSYIDILKQINQYHKINYHISSYGYKLWLKCISNNKELLNTSSDHKNILMLYCYYIAYMFHDEKYVDKFTEKYKNDDIPILYEVLKNLSYNIIYKC